MKFLHEAVRAVGYATLDVAAQCRAAAKSGCPSLLGHNIIMEHHQFE